MIIKAKVLKTGEVIDIVGNLLVAADGCLSSIRQKYLPDFKLRFVSQNGAYFNSLFPSTRRRSSKVLVMFADIRAIVLGEGFLIFQKLRIQIP